MLTFHGGEAGETFSEGSLDGIPYIDRPNSLLFRTGVHKGKRYTAADLDKTVAAFQAPASESDWTVPLQVDHSDSARNTTGNVRSIYRDGGLLRGTVRYIGQEAVNNSKSGVWKKLSIGLRSDMSMHHLAITPHPYVLDAATHSESEDPHVEDKDKVDIAAQFAAMKADLEASFAAKTADQEAARAAEIAKLKAENETLNASVSGMQEVLTFAKLTAKVDTFSTEGKTLPAMREPELALLKSLSDEQVVLYDAYKAAQPKLVIFDTLGSVQLDAPSADEAAADADELEKLRKERGQA